MFTLKTAIYIVILCSATFVCGLAMCPEIKEDCNHYVYYNNEKLCIPEKVKGYIEQLQTKGEDRLKSKRGIFPK